MKQMNHISSAETGIFCSSTTANMAKVILADDLASTIYPSFSKF